MIIIDILGVLILCSKRTSFEEIIVMLLPLGLANLLNDLLYLNFLLELMAR